MAELDNNKLKNLDQELQNLNSHLNDLDQWLKKLQNDMDAAFDEKLIKSWSESIKKIDFSKITKEQLKELQKQISETEKSFEKATTSKRFLGVRIRQNSWKSDLEEVQAARQFLDLLKQINAQEVINKANSSPSKMTEKVVTKESLEAQKKVTDELKKQEAQHKKNNKQLKQNKDTLGSMLPTLQRLASAFGIAFSVRGLVQFGKKLIEARGEFEMQFVAMKQIIGDVDVATKIWNQTMQQALQSPFKAMQLVTYTKQLAAYRIETDKLFDTTKRLADVSAGLGVDMGRLILAYGQVKSANFLRASEVRQFTEAGVNIAGNLAKYFSELEGRAVSTAEVMERITKRVVSFADVEEIFKRMTDEGGEFYKMQEIQANTVKGQLMKLQDAYQQMLNTLGESKEGVIKQLISSLNSLIKNWKLIAIFIQKNVVWLGLLLPLVLSYRRGAKLAAGETLTWAKTMELSSFGFKKFAASIKSGELAMKGFLGMANLAKTALKTFVPLLVIEGLIALTSAITDASRANSRLQADLSKIRSENGKRADDEIGNYDKLIKRMNELNKGSVARKDIIDKINSQYGEYIGFIVDETTSLDDLKNVQDKVNASIRENARARAEEAAEQKIQERFIEREQKILGGNWISRTLGDNASLLGYTDISGTNDISVSVDDAAKFAEFYRKKMHALTDEQVEELSNDKDRLLEVTKEWFESFMGFEVKDISRNTGFKWLADLFLEEEQSIRDSRDKISSELQGLTKEQQEEIKKMDASVEEAIQNLYHAKKGDEIEVYPNVKIGVPTDLSGKEGIFEVIKQEINKHKDDFIIEIKLQAGLISEEQAANARKAGKTTGDVFVDAVNEQIAANILKDAGIDASYEELLKQVLYHPEMIHDWDSVNHVIELINDNLITSGEITNGISSYLKVLSENLENGRVVIDEAVKKQNLLVNGTEEEVKKAQEAVDKARERYKWLLKIAKLFGVETKSVDEIVEEQGYDLSVGQARLEAAQRAFEKKFGKSSNTYGKQLSQIGVTENEKELADAYHKQAEELDGLIKSEETAYNAQKKLGELDEEQLAAIQEKIKNLGVEKEMAEFLALLFGYVPKKTSSRSSHENASKLISLIKEMRGEYDKLSKSAYGYAKSEEKVREAYKDSVKEILGKAGITDYDFTTNEGMIKALEKVKSYATKLGKDAAAEVQKYIDQLETEIEINAQVKIRKDFGKQIEEMFSNYDLTIDLEKLNVPTDELVGIFNLDVTTLDELRRFVDDFYNKQIELGNNPTELVEQVEGYYKKIDEMEKKELRERLKTYSKYLAEGQVEALKIHLEELKKMAELDKLYEQGYFTDTQYKDISNKIRKETDEKLAKNDWQQFKESDFYVTMFEDMSRVSSESIDIMIKRLKSLRKSVNDLNPKQAKEIVKAIEKLEKAKLERSPLKSFLEDWKTAAKWRKDNDNLVKQLGFYASGEEYWSKEQDKQSKKVAELRLEYEELVKNGTPEDAADVKERLDFEEEELSRINEILEDRRQKLDQINQEQNEGYGAQQRVLAGLAQGAQYFSDLASTAGTISTEIMDMFDGVSDASKKLAKDIAEIAANVGILAGDIVKAIASEGTDVGSMIDGLVRTWNIIKGIFSASEYEINYTIEKSTNALKDLEFELERVRRARERAWDTHAYVAAQNELENNIYAQIRAYDAMLAAEEERKNKDEEQIRTWKQEREELFEQLEDERETLLKDFGGIGESEYRNAAQGFVDAWKSAFLETGDGLQGLQDHFDEFLNEWFVKQATMRVAGKMLEPLFRDIDNAVDKYSGGGTSVMMSELAKIRERFGIIAPQLSDTLEELSGLWGIGGEGGLSGLAAGIQGMTEEQANILEAYWNSVRGYTANIDMNVSRIAQILGAGGDNANPMLNQMTLVAQNTTSINRLLDSVVQGSHPMGGSGIKVFAN